MTARKTVGRKATAGKKKTAPRPRPRAAAKRRDDPILFRLNIAVADLARAAELYGTLLGQTGRKQAGARCYFSCGGVTLQVVEVAQPHPAAKALYFTVLDLDAIFERAKALRLLSRESVHGADGGAISVRPWGERSFYADDPWDNPLCFVEAGTIYPG